MFSSSLPFFPDWSHTITSAPAISKLRIFSITRFFSITWSALIAMQQSKRSTGLPSCRFRVCFIWCDQRTLPSNDMGVAVIACTCTLPVPLRSLKTAKVVSVLFSHSYVVKGSSTADLESASILDVHRHSQFPSFMLGSGTWLHRLRSHKASFFFFTAHLTHPIWTPSSHMGLRWGPHSPPPRRIIGVSLNIPLAPLPLHCVIPLDSLQLTPLHSRVS